MRDGRRDRGAPRRCVPWTCRSPPGPSSHSSCRALGRFSQVKEALGSLEAFALRSRNRSTGCWPRAPRGRPPDRGQAREGLQAYAPCRAARCPSTIPPCLRQASRRSRRSKALPSGERCSIPSSWSTSPRAYGEVQEELHFLGGQGRREPFAEGETLREFLRVLAVHFPVLGDFHRAQRDLAEEMAKMGRRKCRKEIQLAASRSRLPPRSSIGPPGPRAESDPPFPGIRGRCGPCRLRGRRSAVPAPALPRSMSAWEGGKPSRLPNSSASAAPRSSEAYIERDKVTTLGVGGFQGMRGCVRALRPNRRPTGSTLAACIRPSPG